MRMMAAASLLSLAMVLGVAGPGLAALHFDCDHVTVHISATVDVPPATVTTNSISHPLDASSTRSASAATATLSSPTGPRPSTASSWATTLPAPST